MEAQNDLTATSNEFQRGMSDALKDAYLNKHSLPRLQVERRYWLKMAGTRNRSYDRGRASGYAQVIRDRQVERDMLRLRLDTD